MFTTLENYLADHPETNLTTGYDLLYDTYWTSLHIGDAQQAYASGPNLQHALDKLNSNLAHTHQLELELA